MAKHEDVGRSLLDEIVALPEHAPLPTEREIAARYTVSRNTVRQALDALETAGHVYRIQGAGTFVANRVVSKSPVLTSFTDDMHERGLHPGSRVLASDVMQAGSSLAESLELAPTDDLMRVSRLRLADDFPMCLENVHLPASRVPGLLDCDLSASLYALIRARYGIEIRRAEQVVCALNLDEFQAALLGTHEGDAGLRIDRIGLDQRDRPVEATTSIYRADRYEVRFAIRRADK